MLLDLKDCLKLLLVDDCINWCKTAKKQFIDKKESAKHVCFGKSLDKVYSPTLLICTCAKG